MARNGWIALALLALGGAAAADELVDGIAAQVGSDIVLLSEVNQLMRPLEPKFREAGATPAEIGRMRATILDKLIERKLIQQAVRRAELGASDAEVDQTIETIARENGLTPEQLRESVESKGLSFDVYRERIRAEIEENKLLHGMVMAKVRLEEQEVRSRYDERFSEQPEGGAEIHLRHLLIPISENTRAARKETCALAAAARERVIAGESFAEVASELSVVNPELGGDIGWLHADSMAAWMQPVHTLEAGGITEVLETSFGCNVLQVVERRDFEPIGYEEARERLQAEIFDEKVAEEYAEFIQKLRSQTYIERKGIFSEADRLAEPATSVGSVEGDVLP